ncbi:MAG TPA: FAD-dependent oxidoreductase [Conexibacter sp.]|nr:FAD-dependent oxidoreductase [Conexibacter sp.]
MSTDVVVMGGGVVGITAAYELARDGARVTLLERGAELGWACSAGNAGMVSSTHALPLASPSALRQGLRWMWRRDSPFYMRPRPGLLPWLARFTAASTPGRAERAGRLLLALCEAGLSRHAAFHDAGLDTGFVRDGLLDAYESPAGLEFGRAEVELRHRLGLTGELLDAERLRELEPALGNGLAGGAYYSDQAYCDPLRFVHAIGAEARALGVDVRCRVEALGFATSGRRLAAVRTTAGEVSADQFVLAAGAWSPALARELGVFLPIEAAKGYHVEFAASEQTPRLPIYMMESKVVATPLDGRLRLSGTLELDGLDLRVDPVRVNAIVQAGERHFPGVRAVVTHDVWRGLRPCAPDGLPIVGRAPQLDNLMLATGHGMAGTTLAPVTAQLVADVMASRPPEFSLDLMRPDRFRPLWTRPRRR